MILGIETLDIKVKIWIETLRSFQRSIKLQVNYQLVARRSLWLGYFQKEQILFQFQDLNDELL